MFETPCRHLSGNARSHMTRHGCDTRVGALRTIHRSAKAAPSLVVHRHFQPLSPPKSFDPFVVHMPTRISQQRCDPTIAVSTIFPGQLDHVGHQTFFVRATNWHPPLRGSVLFQNAACATLRDIQLSTDTVNAGSTASGAQKFPFAASAKISLSSVRTSTCRNFVTISSGFGRLFTMVFLRFPKHSGGPLLWGKTSVQRMGSSSHLHTNQHDFFLPSPQMRKSSLCSCSASYFKTTGRLSY